MPIEKEHNLPHRDPDPPAYLKVGHPVSPPWLRAAFESWVDEVGADKARPKAIEDRLWRSSWSADRCDRQLQYHLRNVPETEPMTIADHWRLTLGKHIGEQIAKHIVVALAEHGETYTVKAEVPTDLNPIDIDGSSFVEILVSNEDGPVQVIEVKSINGMGFKEVSIGWNGRPAQPRWGHVVQACVEAAAYGVPATLVYIATELVGAGIAKSKGLSDLERFTVVWRFTTEEVEAIALAESKRIARVLSKDEPVVRFIHDPTTYPQGALITDPSKGTWVTRSEDGQHIDDMGTVWYCAYCPFRQVCLDDGA